LVEKGAKFSHLTDGEKDGILMLARELKNSGSSLTDVSKRIANRLGRSPEAVRYTIKNFDRVHPDLALFPKLAGPLNGNAKEQLYEWPLLTKDQEQHMFRKMNFLKYKLQKLQESIDPVRAKVSEMRQLEELREQIRDVRDVLINCNQRLVYSQAKQRLGIGES